MTGHQTGMSRKETVETDGVKESEGLNIEKGRRTKFNRLNTGTDNN